MSDILESLAQTTAAAQTTVTVNIGAFLELLDAAGEKLLLSRLRQYDPAEVFSPTNFRIMVRAPSIHEADSQIELLLSRLVLYSDHSRSELLDLCASKYSTRSVLDALRIMQERLGAGLPLDPYACQEV